MVTDVTNELAFGMKLFEEIFAIAPGALDLFSFKDEWGKGESEAVNDHVLAVVTHVAKAVSKLEDSSTLVPILRKLGKKHAEYGILPAHYDVVGQAVVRTITHFMTPTDELAEAFKKFNAFRAKNDEDFTTGQWNIYEDWDTDDDFGENRRPVKTDDNAAPKRRGFEKNIDNLLKMALQYCKNNDNARTFKTMTKERNDKNR